MIAYSYTDAGIYAGEYACQPNPLVKGEFLLPANATLEKPPELGADQIAVWDGSAWQVKEAPKPVEEEVKIEKRLSPKEKKAQAMAALKVIRNRLLAESDFAMLPDAPQAIKDKLPEIIAYRQALRDITKTVTDATKPYELPKKPF